MFAGLDCRMFKVKGVREIITRLSNGSSLTKGNMHDIVTREWQADANEELYIRRGQAGKPSFTTIFDELLDKRIIRPGFAMKCKTCFAEGWYHVSEFTEEFTCRFCFTRQRVDFGAKHEWQYKADGLFQIRNGALGSLAVVISLWRFADLSALSSGKYASSLRLKDNQSKREYEIDFVYLQTSGWAARDDLVFGECAGHIDLTQTDADKMRLLVDRFDRRPYLSFSTLKDEFSDGEKVWLRAVVRPLSPSFMDVRVLLMHAIPKFDCDLGDLTRRNLASYARSIRHTISIAMKALSEVN